MSFATEQIERIERIETQLAENPGVQGDQERECRAAKGRF